MNERDLQLCVISVQLIFEGIFSDHQAKRSCIMESESSSLSIEPWNTPQERVESFQECARIGR